VADYKLLVGKKIIFIPLIAVLFSFGLGGLWLKDRSDHQMPIKTTKLPRVMAVTNTQGSDSKGETVTTVNSHIFEVPKQFQGKVIKQVQLNDTDKVIALTFDDGPAPKYTEQILQILKQQNIKATFFCVGEMVHNFPQIAKLEVADGHAIGNHTWHHWYRKLNPSTAAKEIESTATQIYETMGVKTSLFRPPGGVLNNGVVDYAEKNNYAVLMWSDDAEDYRRPPVSKLVSDILRDAKPGGIVLMHDGGGNRSNTVKALPLIIDALRKRGYRFVTIPELLEMQKVSSNTPPHTTSHPADATTSSH